MEHLISLFRFMATDVIHMQTHQLLCTRKLIDQARIVLHTPHYSMVANGTSFPVSGLGDSAQRNRLIF